MVSITIHDDDFVGVLKDMTVVVDLDTIKKQGKLLTEAVAAAWSDLFGDWWNHRGRTFEEVYGVC